MAIYSTDYNKIVDEQRKNLANAKKSQQDSVNKMHDNIIAAENKIYNKAVNDTEIKYESDYQKNAVQKLINEKQIAETNANLGLTDSGLNRTQQTAAQLSYANQKGNIDLQKQRTLDELSQNLAASLSSIEQSRISGLAEVDSNFESLAQQNAYDIYNTNVSANAKMYEAQQAASKLNTPVQNSAISNTPQKIYWFRGVSDVSGNYLYYNTKTGKNEEVPPYMNPYTSNDNRLSYRAEYNDKSIGFFQLADGTVGYQPRGLVSEGGKFTRLEVDGKPVQFDLYGNGKYNSIWYSPSGHYWIWDDLSNSYKNMDSQTIEYLRKVL